MSERIETEGVPLAYPDNEKRRTHLGTPLASTREVVAMTEDTDETGVGLGRVELPTSRLSDSKGARENVGRESTTEGSDLTPPDSEPPLGGSVSEQRVPRAYPSESKNGAQGASSASPPALDLDAIIARVQGARAEVAALCNGPRRGGHEWRMCIPVQPTDSDEVICASLADVWTLLLRVRQVESALRALSDPREFASTTEAAEFAFRALHPDRQPPVVGGAR